MTTKADETVRMEDRGSPRVLVVDDEPHIVELVRYNLQQEGFAVSVATSGREALARVASDRPDLVVLDIMLPELDGIEVCRQIRAESRVPILMLTARDREVDRGVGREMGADGEGVRTTQTLDAPPQPGLHARLPPGAHLGLRLLRQHAHGGHAHQPAAREDRGRPRRLPLHPDRPRGGLQVQGRHARPRPTVMRSIRFKLIATYVALAAGVLLGVTAVMLGTLHQRYLDTYQYVVATQARLLGTISTEYSKEGHITRGEMEAIAQRF